MFCLCRGRLNQRRNSHASELPVSGTGTLPWSDINRCEDLALVLEVAKTASVNSRRSFHQIRGYADGH